MHGVVRFFHADEGWGVVDGDDVPGGSWVHFSAIVMDGPRLLTDGQRVSFWAEPAQQDAYAYRVVKLWTSDEAPPERERENPPSEAYSSALTLSFDED